MVLIRLPRNGKTQIGSIDRCASTIDQAASQIVRGEPGWSASLGIPFTVTYAYRADEPASMPVMRLLRLRASSAGGISASTPAAARIG